MISLALKVLFLFISIISIIKAQKVPAFPADSFVESIGINAHWGNTDVYTQNYTQLKEKLRDAGIRYVRDGTFHATYVRANDLYYSLGIRTNILTGKRKSGLPDQPLDPTKLDEELDDIKTQMLATIVTLEAPNEYDLSHGPDPDWISTIKNYSTSLYIKAKADEMLKNFPVIGPSLTSYSAYDTVGDLDPYINYANLHMYQSRRWPGCEGWDVNSSRSITWYLDYLARHQSPSGKLVQSTEAGYHNHIGHDGISEEADGKYTGRMFAEFFRRGVYRTYKYELVNKVQANAEHLFGLLRMDVSEKPCFRAVKNLINLLNDKGPNFPTDQLNYVVNGSMNNVRQLLFQKRNGDFYLMIWLEVSSWDVNANIDLYPPPQQITLTLNDNTTNRISMATLYALNNSADMNTYNLTINNNQLIFNVTDKISIIKLSNGTKSTIFRALYEFRSKSNDTTQWIIESAEDDFYRLINPTNKQVLIVDSCQKWRFEPLSVGYYYRIIPNHIKNQSLDAQFQLSSWKNLDQQYWKLNFIKFVI